MGERVAVTGGAGFIGCALARTLLDRGDEVWIVDSFSRGPRDPDFETVARRAWVVEHDLTHPLPPSTLPAGLDAVYHLAARVGVGPVTAQPYATLRNNLLTTLHVLDFTVNTPGVRVCFASTSEVYAESVARGVAPLPTPEGAPLLAPPATEPRSSYAVSKLAGERLLLHAAQQHGVRALVARLHNVYGPRMGYAHVIPHFILRALEGADPFEVFGVQTRAFCYVDDAVEALLGAMAALREAPLVANVGSDREEVRTDDLALRVCRLAGYEPPLAPRPAPPGSPERRVPDLSRLRALTGYEPRVGLDEGLARTFAWYRAEWAAGRAPAEPR